MERGRNKQTRVNAAIAVNCVLTSPAKCLIPNIFLASTRRLSRRPADERECAADPAVDSAFTLRLLRLPTMSRRQAIGREEGRESGGDKFAAADYLLYYRDLALIVSAASYRERKRYFAAMILWPRAGLAFHLIGRSKLAVAEPESNGTGPSYPERCKR